MAASPTVAKKKGNSGSTPQFHATVTYKIWVWKQIKQRGLTLPALAQEMKRRGTTATDGGLSLFLGPEDLDEPRVPSNTSWMPVINRIFGMPDPAIFDPTDDLALQRDRFFERYRRLSPRERAVIDAFIFGDSSDEQGEPRPR